MIAARRASCTRARIASGLPASPRERTGIDALCRGQRPAHALGLGVGRVAIARTATKIGLARGEEILEAAAAAEGVYSLKYLQHGRGIELQRPVQIAVVACRQEPELATVVRHADALAQCLDELDAARLVAGVPRPLGAGVVALPRSCVSAAKRTREAVAASGRVVDDHHGVHPRIHFGMEVRALRYPEQAVHLGENARQRAGFAQGVEHARRFVFHQAARELLPDPLRDQRFDLAVVDHLAHERERLRRDVEPEARCEACHPQDAHGILGEGRAHVPQDACLEIGDTAERIDDVARLVLGDGIDGEVAPRQVRFERHVRRGVEVESLVAGGGLALGARERVLLVRVGMEKDREVLADRAETQTHHLVRRAADDHEILILDRQAEERVSHRAADAVTLHPRPPTAWRPARVPSDPRAGESRCSARVDPGDRGTGERRLRWRWARTRAPRGRGSRRRCPASSSSSCRASSRARAAIP